MNYKYFLGIGCLAYLFFSFLLYINIPPDHPHLEIDSPGYETKALLFYTTNSFVQNVDQKTGDPTIQQPIGYPLIIGTLYKIFWPSRELIIFFQVLTALLCGLLIFTTTWRLFNLSVACIAFGLFTFNLGFILFPQFILTEIFSTFFLVLFFERLSKFYITKRYLPLALAGLALGISTIIKPAALYYFVPLSFVLLLFFNDVWRKKIVAISLFSLLFFAPIVGYMGYNKTVYNCFRFTSSDNFNVYVWFGSKVAIATIPFSSSKEFHQRFEQECETRKALLDFHASNVDDQWIALKRSFWQAAAAKPSIFIYAWTKEMLKTFLGLYTTNLKVLVEPATKGGDISFFTATGSLAQKVTTYITAGTTLWWVKTIEIMETLLSLLRYLFCLVGLFVLLRSQRWLYLFTILSYVGYFSFVTGFDGCARYRMMFEFILIIIAALGIYALIRQKSDDRQNLYTHR